MSLRFGELSVLSFSFGLVVIPLLSFEPNHFLIALVIWTSLGVLGFSFLIESLSKLRGLMDSDLALQFENFKSKFKILNRVAMGAALLIFFDFVSNLMITLPNVETVQMKRDFCVSKSKIGSTQAESVNGKFCFQWIQQQSSSSIDSVIVRIDLQSFTDLHNLPLGQVAQVELKFLNSWIWGNKSWYQITQVSKNSN